MIRWAVIASTLWSVVAFAQADTPAVEAAGAGAASESDARGAWLETAAAAVMDGDWVAAAAAYGAAVREDPAPVEPWYRLGVAHALAGDAASAAVAFRQVRERAPEFPEIDARIAAADARAARDEAEAIDPPGVLDDPAMRAQAREAALED